MSNVRLDLDKRVMRVDDRPYFFKVSSDYDSDRDSEAAATDFKWFKESKQYVTLDPEDSNARQFAIEDTQHVRPPGGGEWSPARVRIKEPEKLKELTRAFRKAEPEAIAVRQDLKDIREWLKTNRASDNPTNRRFLVQRLSGSDSDSDPDMFDWEVVVRGRRYLHKANKKLRSGWWKIEEDWIRRVHKQSPLAKELEAAVIQSKGQLKHEHSERVAKSTSNEKPKDNFKKDAEVPKRTKWGTRVWSNDKEHYFAVGVWNSTKFEGCTTVRLSVAGGNYMYTLDKAQMAALRGEISRGQPT